MTTIEHRSDANLEDLRCQLTRRLAVLPLVGAGGLVVWRSLLHQPVPGTLFFLLALLVGLGLGVRKLVPVHPRLARHLLIWSFSAGLLIAMWLLHDLWLPFLGLVLIFVGAMLVSGSELAIAGVIIVLAGWLTLREVRAYPISPLLAALAVDLGLAWLVIHTLYTALEWAWTMHQRADRLLEVARDRQAELSRTMKSLDLANTILRRTQRDLIIARRQAEEARLMKEQFAANVSHELRTPLNIILGFSEVMCLYSEVYGDIDWPPALRQDVYQIYRSSRHLLEMIDDVLDLSRFEMMGFTLNREPTPIGPLLQDAVDMSLGLFRQRPVHLQVAIAQDLPILEIDHIRIRQVLLNLLKNAAHFTEEGAVHVEAKQEAGEVVVSVSDTGPGIPEHEIPRLFDEFYQVDRSLHRRHGGTGLGLAISKRFVEAHDGHIWVESTPGVGSTFTFTLPILGKYAPLSPLSEAQPLEPSSPEARPLILVVDQDPGVATLILRHVEEYEVVQVEKVDRLMEEVILRHPQAVVWNRRPGERVEQDAISPLPVPCIECSLPSAAWVADDIAVKACLNKPITAERLLQEIEQVGNVCNVLVVDDDRAFCRLVERMLKASGRGFKVQQAYDGGDGLQAMRARRPDLLLLDLVMPEVDGLQVLEEMRREPQLMHVPVVLLTATSFAEDTLSRSRGRMVIRRPDGLHPVEVLACLRAVINLLQPRYDERWTPDKVLAGYPM